MANNDMTDLFGTSSNIKLSRKWNINNFLSNPGNYRSTSSSVDSATGTMTNDMKLELDRTIKAIEISYSKSSLDFDKIFRDLSTRRKELKALMVELQATAKPVDIAALWSVESNLIVNQIRALENKQKIESEKFKQIRDEKKLMKEKVVASPDNGGNNNGVTNIITNSPLATANNLAAVNAQPNKAISVGNIDPNLILKSSSVFNKDIPVIEDKKPETSFPIPTTVVAKEPVTVETTAEQTVVNTPSVEEVQTVAVSNNSEQMMIAEGDTVVSTNLIGDKVVTVNDIQSGINERVAQRLNDRDNILKNEKTITGYNYQHSLDTIVSKSIPHVEKLFICPHTGEYYTRAYTKDESGNYTKEITNFPLKSITHIGQLSLNPLHKKATFYYYPDAKDYTLVDNMDNAPEFYKNEWLNPKTEKYKLDYDTCQSLIDAES